MMNYSELFAIPAHIRRDSNELTQPFIFCLELKIPCLKTET